MKPLVDPEAAPAPGGLRRDGVWSFGLRLFRRMSFGGKATLISAILLLVVIQLSVIFLRASNHGIRVAERELVGVAYVRELAHATEQAQQLRRVLVGQAGSAAPAAEEALRQMAARLDRLEASYASEPALIEAFKFVREAFSPLQERAADPEEAFAKGDALVQQLLRMTATTVNVSALSQDAEAASFHLMQASTRDILDIMHMMGRVRDLGSDALSASQLAPYQQRIVQGDSYVLYARLEALFARFEDVRKANPPLGEQLAFEDVFTPANAFMRAVRKGPLAASGPAGDPAAFLAAGQAAVEAMVGMADRSYAALEGLIGERIAHEKNSRNLQLVLAFSGLLVAAYFFHCFNLATRQDMQEITRHIHAMAHGDLSTTLRPEGEDEAAMLMRSIAEMQGALRDLVGQVRSCAKAIVLMGVQVSAGAQDLSGRTEKASGSLQQTALAMEKIATTVKDTAGRTGESAVLAQDNARVASRGGEVVSQVVSTMQGIQSSSQKINDIISVIDSIAFQTNILALNAAVEAARAGAHGRSFAVVAGEVRALAQRSADAAREIKALIHASAEQTESGTRIVSAAGETMAQLVQNARTMSDMLSQVSRAAEAQTRGVTDVSQAVAQLDEDIQHNAELVEQTTSATASMNQLAHELSAAADRFVLPD